MDETDRRTDKTERDTIIVEPIRQVAQVDSMKTDFNFHLLGAHSISVTQMHECIYLSVPHANGVKITVSLFVNTRKIWVPHTKARVGTVIACKVHISLFVALGAPPASDVLSDFHAVCQEPWLSLSSLQSTRTPGAMH